MEIPLIALHSDSEFLLPQAPPSLFDPGDEPTQRAPVSTPDADLRFDADQQIPPPECCSSTFELPTCSTSVKPRGHSSTPLEDIVLTHLQICSASAASCATEKLISGYS